MSASSRASASVSSTSAPSSPTHRSTFCPGAGLRRAMSVYVAPLMILTLSMQLIVFAADRSPHPPQGGKHD